MKRIKSYKLFLEEFVDTKRISYNQDQYLKTIDLFHVGEHIYAVRISDRHSRAMVFLRPQEYYESIFNEIAQKQFKFSKFQDLYKQHYGKQEFTYGDDWSGFNIPSNILEDCMFGVDPEDINNYDKIMLSIIQTIKKIEGNHLYYLLGVDELDNHLLEHEFAHAMYFTLPDYKAEMTKLTSECDPKVKDSMYKCITDYGYADHVLADEMQAYMSTGLGKKMKELNIENIDEWMSKYREIFQRNYSKNLYPEAKQLEVSWEV